MTTFRHPQGKTFRYDFYFRGERYTGNTLQTTKADADLVESDLKKKLRLQAGGLQPPDAAPSIAIQDWAEVSQGFLMGRHSPEPCQHAPRVALASQVFAFLLVLLLRRSV